MFNRIDAYEVGVVVAATVVWLLSLRGHVDAAAFLLGALVGAGLYAVVRIAYAAGKRAHRGRG